MDTDIRCDGWHGQLWGTLLQCLAAWWIDDVPKYCLLYYPLLLLLMLLVLLVLLVSLLSWLSWLSLVMVSHGLERKKRPCMGCQWKLNVLACIVADAQGWSSRIPVGLASPEREPIVAPHREGL